MASTMNRAYTTVVLAMSADGKITDRDRTAARFSSPNDLAHLETVVAAADGVLFGAGTLRAYGTCLSVRQPSLIAQRQAQRQPLQPVQIVCSNTGNLDPQLQFFQQSVPRWLLTSPAGAQRWPAPGEAFGKILPTLTTPIHWLSMLQQLKAMGLKRLAVLGGGTLIAGLVEQDMVDELYLTVCPLLIGGQRTPTPVDGQGLKADLALRLRLVQTSTSNDEVFLHYRRCHPQGD
ncbi:MAG: dihydrofolate reductase family protein [Cyanobacteria bacterium P01_D01_bin.115]